MNEKIMKLFHKKNSTVYKVHQETGIAYTTLSEIFHGKININKCAAETVFKLTLYFDCTIEEILNPLSLLTNVEGSYRGINYKWLPDRDGKVKLKIRDGEKEKIIDTGSQYAQRKFYKEYILMTETLIDVYMQQKEAEAMLDDTIYANA